MDFGDFTLSISLRALRRRSNQGSQGFGEKNMKRNDSEVISTSSSTSKGSERRKNRFSLRRIFYQGRSGRTKSHLSLNSNSSAQSEYSFVVGEKDRDHGEGRNLGAMAAAGIAASSSSSEDSSAQLNLPLPSTSAQKAKGSEKERECPLCLMEYPVESFPEISTCYHRSCLSCLRMYLRIEITESRVNIACPECAEKFHPNDIKDIVQDEALMTKYEDFMVRRVLVSDPDARWCPAPDCGCDEMAQRKVEPVNETCHSCLIFNWPRFLCTIYAQLYAVIAKECAGCPKIKCERPGCDTFFCYHCKQYWHPNKTCDAARAERLLDARAESLTYSQESDFQKDFIKPCPRCSAFIMKMNDGSCNHMTCPVCGAEFCWLCMKEISDLHYLSPSGCTFWGKKPWSRKKKILWQLGTLVGAPVGITLLAGIAVPAMVIGIPVWVGRKIHSKYEGSTRPRRNLAIAGGVTVSVLVSPIVAGLAVGIGVPILLGYVYGVVPISLCRSGGCGVRTTNNGGVRFEFEEENETGIPSAMYSGVDSQSVGTGHQVANPSIAPSIGEASVGMANSIYSASGSHMDRVGIVRDESDRDSASNRAIAGASLNGSMCGSTYAAVLGLQTKLEVQAEMETDIPPGKRASFSSESANFSIGEKSIGEKSVVGDDASTRGLAGSIANYKMDSASITNPSEVHVDISKPGQLSLPQTDSEHSNITTINSGGTPRDGEISSLTSGLSQDEKKKINSCPGSPLSGCGSLCDHEENGKQHNLRCRKCRRNAKLAEKATEQMNVHFSDQVSLQSFQADDMVLDLPMGKHDIDSLSEMCNEEDSESDEGLEKCKGKRLAVRNNSEPAILLTEVESDHPEFCKAKEMGGVCDGRCPGKHKCQLSRGEVSEGESLASFASSISMKFGMTDGMNNHDESLLSRCRSEDIYKKKEIKEDIVSEKSKSEEIFNKDKSGAVGGGMKRVRRKSCELAIQNGRISPLSVISDD